jgi:hypothetical protein
MTDSDKIDTLIKATQQHIDNLNRWIDRERDFIKRMIADDKWNDAISAIHYQNMQRYQHELNGVYLVMGTIAELWADRLEAME